MHKSKVSYSPNIKDRVWNAIHGVLGINANEPYKKYPGLPSFIRKNKKATFDMMKMKVGKISNYVKVNCSR